MQINVPIFGPTYTNRSLDVGAQITQNFYPEINPGSTEPTSLMPFPGLTLFSTPGGGPNRGMGTLNGTLYIVNGNSLYRISTTGVATNIGVIPGNGRVVMISDGTNLVITTGVSKPYTYDGATLRVGTDEDLHTSNSVAFINQRVVYDGAAGQVIFADLTEPLDISSENILSAEAHPDNSDFVWSFRQQVFVAGPDTIQPYWNSGTGNPPYDPIINSTLNLGVRAKYSIDFNKEYTYFLASDGDVYQYDGLSARPVGNPAICQAISKYTDSTDAFGICFSFDGMDFYLLSFPTAGKTWLFSENTGLWTSLAYGTSGGQHLINSHRYIYNKHIVADRRSGRLYFLDFDNYTDNGDVIQRRRDTTAISAKELEIGRPNSALTMNWLRLLIEPGVGQIDTDTWVIMEYSDNNGKTWSSEHWSKIGDLGEFDYGVEWYQLGTFKNRMFRFTMTDPVKWVLIDCIADVEVGID